MSKTADIPTDFDNIFVRHKIGSEKEEKLGYTFTEANRKVMQNYISEKAEEGLRLAFSEDTDQKAKTRAAYCKGLVDGVQFLLAMHLNFNNPVVINSEVK